MVHIHSALMYDVAGAVEQAMAAYDTALEKAPTAPKALEKPKKVPSTARARGDGWDRVAAVSSA